MVLELRNETAALKAQLELQTQEVSVLLEYFIIFASKIPELNLSLQNFQICLVFNPTVT